MNDTATPRAEAASLLASCFFEIVCEEGVDFESFESRCISLGHSVMADAMSIALERFDARLCLDLPAGCRVHDRRGKTLASEVGDLHFRYRRVRDRFGNTVVPYADALDLPWGARVTPGARSFLVEAGAEVSYQKAANLLARNGSRVSATTVMNAVRQAGALCAEEDAELAEDLFVNGVMPGGEVESSQVLVEADGTWIRLQNVREGDPERVEIKALVAYGSKAREGGKTRRVSCVHHGCVATPDAFWTQGVAAIGTRFDLSKVEACHLGTDGEGWCKRGAEFLPSRISTAGHLDPFHVNRAVLSCFDRDGAVGAWHVLDVLNDGDKEEACLLLEAMRDMGVAREKRTTEVVGYLRNNVDLIAVEGPSLGTMESENQHLYGARMDSVPCAWSRPGASAMARVVSRRHSHREIPRMTRSRSLTPRRAERRERRILAALNTGGAGKMVESVGKGYLPPHQASVAGMAAEVRYAAGIDSGMIAMQG
ncbi:MAG: UPF0236 family protein [Muribaculaceae bacterium]|nr:UPF0236 family protein [Muribaculaceae bacterium]